MFDPSQIPPSTITPNVPSFGAPQPPASQPPPQAPPVAPPQQQPPQQPGTPYAPPQPPPQAPQQPPSGFVPPADPYPQPQQVQPVQPQGWQPPPAAAPVQAYQPPAGGFQPNVSQVTYHANVQSGSLDDEEIKTGNFDIYKARAKHIDRVGVVVPKNITWGRTHYIDGKGYFICQSTFEKQGGQEVPTRLAPCCQKLGSPKKRFACLIAHYATDPAGNLVRPFSFSLKVWRFGEQTFEQLRTQNRDMPLERHDIKINCTDETFQKVTFSTCGESLVHTSQFREAADAQGRNYGQQVDAYVAAVTPQLQRTIGTVATPAEWAVLIGQPGLGDFGGAGGVGSTIADQPIQDIRQLLGSS